MLIQVINRRGPPASAESSLSWEQEMTFAQYADSAAFLADNTNWDTVEREPPAGTDMSIVSRVYSTYTKALQYRFPSVADGCVTITRRNRLPFSFGTSQEIFVRFITEWSTNFSTAQSRCAPNDHKYIFIDTEAGESGRVALYVGNGSPPTHAVRVERPSATGGTGDYALSIDGGASPNPTAQSLWTSGVPHAIDIHFKCSTTTSSNDGEFHIWIDEELIHRETGFSHAKPAGEGGGPDRLTGVSFCHNKDDTPDNTEMFCWWYFIGMNRSDPGNWLS